MSIHPLDDRRKDHAQSKVNSSDQRMIDKRTTNTKCTSHRHLVSRGQSSNVVMRNASALTPLLKVKRERRTPTHDNIQRC